MSEYQCLCAEGMPERCPCNAPRPTRVTGAMVDRVIQAMHDHGWLGWGPDEEGPGPERAHADVRLFLELAISEAENAER